MAKVSAVERNLKRIKLSEQHKNKRDVLKKIIYSPIASAEDKFDAMLKLAKMPRNGSPSRIRNRCEVTGRPRGFYRRFKMSRIAVREFGSLGVIPGVRKASW